MSLPFWVLQLIAATALLLVGIATLLRYASWRAARRGGRRKGYILGR